jgi:hypothetical protein
MFSPPGLLLPLWWFIAQPLGPAAKLWAASAAATTMVGAAHTAGVLTDSVNLARLGCGPIWPHRCWRPAWPPLVWYAGAFKRRSPA